LREFHDLVVVTEDCSVSIVRVGLAETKNFAEGWEAIFGKKKNAGAKKETAAKPAARSAAKKKKKAPRKK
jgi:hypothetical protein